MVEFDRVDEALDDAAVQAAEAHGVLAGMLCAAGAAELGDWWSAIREDESQVKVPEPVRELHAETVASLADVTGTFDLMLPTDEASLEERAEALHDWCQGFLYGYGLAGGRDPVKLLPDAAEVLRDIHQFAQASFDLGEDAEEDEQAYSDLVEYLRVGVLLLHETLHPRPEPATGVKAGAAGAWPQAGSRTLH
ncbi:UPF0149 family protein [Thiofaba sp. EF100]|uniref:UPF0149 family protein n=1 Tax=Thiofaba sp. EF100 TaxID=3121274 RepID=UPI003221D6F3